MTRAEAEYNILESRLYQAFRIQASGAWHDAKDLLREQALSDDPQEVYFHIRLDPKVLIEGIRDDPVAQRAIAAAVLADD